MARLKLFLVRSLPALACVLLLCSPSAWANQSELEQTPHGARFGCPLCHAGGQFGPGDRTLFGAQVTAVAAGGNYAWSDIYALDADADGASNGLELGDPDGLWRAGAPAPDGVPTDPNDPTSFPEPPDPCGNGALDPPEECDGAELAGQTCETLGFDEGTLSCSANCTFHTGCCRAPGEGFCGDGIINGGEACDGERLLGRSCLTQGFSGGVLVCAPDCTLDASGCDRDGQSVCGDGARTGAEACDGVFLGGEDCEGLGMGTGTLACDETCQFDIDACEEPEVCDDGADNDGDGGADCEDRDCLGAAGCPTCGDGVAEGIEPCDGDDFAATCQSEGFASGAVGCTPTCELDTAQCAQGGGSGGGCSTTAPATIHGVWSLFLRRAAPVVGARAYPGEAP